MKPYRHVIWDWNGTLFDDLPVVVDVMNGLLEARDLPALTFERYREIFDFPVRNYYAAAGFDLGAEPFEVLAAEWIAAYRERWQEGSLRQGAKEVMLSLASGEVGQTVLSAAERGLLLEQAAHFGVIEHCAELVGIDDHHAESKVDHGRRWLEGAGIDPAMTVLVGDTTHDFEVGLEIGVDVILFGDGHQARERLAACGAPVIDSLAELVGLVTAEKDALR